MERGDSGRRRSRSRSRSQAPADRTERGGQATDTRRRSRSRSRSRRRARRRRSPSSSSSSDSDAALYEGFHSDSDDQDDRAVGWMRRFGRKAHLEPRRPAPIRGDSLLEVVQSAQRLNVVGKYGNWDDYLRFLHRHSRRCRPPPGRRPEGQTQFLLRNFLRSLHATDRRGLVDRKIREHRDA